MAVAASLNLNVLPDPTDRTQQSIVVYGNLTLSGNYGAGGSHGDTLDLSQLGIPSGQLPSALFVYEEPTAGNAPTGYSFLYARGTTQANGKLIVMQGGAAASNPMAEITQGGAYPGALTAATANIKFEATFSFGL